MRVPFASLRLCVLAGAAFVACGAFVACRAARASDHWAFRAPVRPAVPAVRDSAWVANPIDAFVLARLEAEGLVPSPAADRTTLVRRLSLDLLGLPPTPEEIDRFLDDDAAPADAYAKVVDRLLASPYFGERQGRHWLDAARYADSDGFEKDKARAVWFYRDWVIDALDRDLPYDEFIVEQIAGDLLPDASQDQIVATGFLRNSMVNEEGGIDPEEFRMQAMFDRIDAIGKSILGVTIQCAQCHDHKFDPLAQAEYYRLFAFLNNDHEANRAVWTPAEQMVRARVLRGIRAIEAELRHRTPDWEERMARWEETVRDGEPEWIVVRPAVDEISNGGQRYLPQDDGSLLALGYAPTKHRVHLIATTELESITAFRLELLNDPNLPLGGPGRSIFGTGALTELEVEVAPASEPSKTAKVELAAASADIELPEAPLDSIYDDRSNLRRVTGPSSFAIDGKDETAWGIDQGPGRRNQPRKAVFVAAKPIGAPGGSVLHIYLTQNHGGWNSDDNQNHNLGRFRLSVTKAPAPRADPLPERVRETLAVPRAERSAAQTAAVFRFWRTTVDEWRDANERIEALWREYPAGSSQLVLAARDAPRETRRLDRGDFLAPREQVTPGVPAFLHPLDGDGNDHSTPPRLAFARWLVDRRAPTTARAIVNRVWQSYFSTGIVETSEDLGTQSPPPSHPELLDWLAVELVDSGWSLRRLHRLIVTSSTYRQSSHVTPELLARDPQNRLVARGPRSRVEGEVVRDIALAASGLLVRRIGGPSVYPPLPEFLLAPPVSYGPKVWTPTSEDDAHRRGLYTFRYRSVPYPVLETFDVPNGDASCVRRVRSNTPLQALVTLNEPVFVDCARALAQRALAEGGSRDATRLGRAFRLAVGRLPQAVETETLLELLATSRERFAADDDRARQLAGAPSAALAAGAPSAALAAGATGFDVAELAAWTLVARVLLNLDETITRE